MMRSLQFVRSFFVNPHKAKRRWAGFTLIELIVALSIFSVLIVSTIDILIITLRVQNRVAVRQAIQDNARFSLELMTKEMRTGVSYSIASPQCAAAGQEIHFIGTSGPRVYFFDTVNKKIMRATVPILSPADCANAVSLTADEVQVQQLSFVVRGEDPGRVDGQAMLTIAITIAPDLSLQTTVVQRFRES